MALRRQDRRDDREFNSPEEMVARLGYLICLAMLPAGVLLVIAGVISQRFLLLIAGVAALATGWLMREGLRKREQLDPAARSLDAVPMLGSAAEETRLARLVALLREWDALEQRRGTAAFDPWAVQAVRNDIVAVIEQDPALLSLFRAHRHAA
jgi:hypothetical protein